MRRGAFLEYSSGSARIFVTQILQAARGLRLLPTVSGLELGQGAGYFVGCRGEGAEEGCPQHGSGAATAHGVRPTTRACVRRLGGGVQAAFAASCR